MEEANYTIRIPPCPAYDVEGTESWLSDLAAEGLLLSRDGFFMGFAYFEKAQPQHMKYRLEAAEKNPSLWAADGCWQPDDEAVALSEAYGWEFVTNRGQFYIYRSSQPGTRELNTDPEVQALALEAVRKRQKGNIHRAFFWWILYPLLHMRGNLFLAMVSTGTLFVLFGIGLLLWNLWDTLKEALHLRRLRKKLLEEGVIDHKKDWKKRAGRYHLKNSLNILLIALWFIILLTKWSNDIMETNLVDLRDYTGDPPFATLADLAGEDYKRLDYTVFGYGNNVREWSDLLSPINYDWREIGEIKKADGTVLDGGLYIKYHETVHPWVAQQLCHEYIRHDQWRESLWQKRDRFTPFDPPELAADYVFAYYDEIHVPNLVLRKDSTVIHVSFSQFGEDAMSLEEWAGILAASIG